MKKKVISLMLVAMMAIPFSANAVLAEDSGEKTVVTFQTWNPGDTSATQEMIAMFEEAHPDIEINFVSIPYVDHVEKLKVDLSAGEAADVYGIQTGAMYTEFRDFEEDLTPYMVEAYGEDWVSDFNSYAMSLLQAEDEAYYALPLGLSYAGYVWVNQTYLDKYDIATPQSYDDLKAASEILRENGEYPLAIGAKDDWINIDVWMNIAGDVNAEKLYSAIEGETPFTDEDLVESFRIWQNLFTEGVFQDGALGVNMYTDTTDLYEREGSIPMLVNGTWDLGTYVNVDEQMQVVFNSEDSNHEIVLIDWNNDGTPAHCQETVDVSLAINSMSPNKEAAWTFVDWMTHEGADFLCNQLSYLPARLSSELNVEGLSEDGQGCLDVAIENGANNVGGYREMAYGDLKTVIQDELKELAMGDITPEDAAEIVEAASQVQER